MIVFLLKADGAVCVFLGCSFSSQIDIRLWAEDLLPFREAYWAYLMELLLYLSNYLIWQLFIEIYS